MSLHTAIGGQGVDPALLIATQRLATGSWACSSVKGSAFAATLAGFGFDVVRLDLGGVADKATAIERCLAAVDAPGWAGHNWDALYDVLVDRFGRDDTAALVITDARTIASTPVGSTLESLVVDAAAELGGRGRAFYAIWTPAGPTTTPVIDDVV
ncbi:MAG: barstar family protein [Acidimicrobiales bacterium]